MRRLAPLLLAALGCGASVPPCDTAGAMRCMNGVVTQLGCGGESVVAMCGSGCVAEGMTTLIGCPQSLCRAPGPKKAGDRCQSDDGCRPTPATVSSTGVVNTYLTCDLFAGVCVTAPPPVVPGWLAPCSGSLIASLSADGDAALDGADPDMGCASGLCAVMRAAGASCVANACTISCVGDEDCPTGAACVFKDEVVCGAQPKGYCKPGGPNGVGFTCR